jgi:ribosomal protein S5
MINAQIDQDIVSSHMYGKIRFIFINSAIFLQVTGKCGSVQVRLIPAPRGTGIVSAPVPKKLLQMAGIEDCYTSARGSTGTLGNFGKQLLMASDVVLSCACAPII